MAKKKGRKPKLGSGKRFAAIARKAGGGKKGRAIAAAIGHKKYGKRRMSKMAAAGRRRKARARKRK
jgi:hypothetical protein